MRDRILPLVIGAVFVLGFGALLAQVHVAERDDPWTTRHVITPGDPGDDEWDDEGCDCPPYPAPVQTTGQTECWDTYGNAIDCAGTGQDGEYQTGVSVSPRFTENGDGTVTDNLTGLIWLQHMNCLAGYRDIDEPGEVTWAEALSFANNLADGACGLTDGSVAGDWRLPNVRELHSLVDYGQWHPALPPDHPFVGLIGDWYWSSTASEWDLYAWLVCPDTGDVRHYTKLTLNFVWPVRDALP
jgi:hypothetical protein